MIDTIILILLILQSYYALALNINSGLHVHLLSQDSEHFVGCGQLSSSAYPMTS